MEICVQQPQPFSTGLATLLCDAPESPLVHIFVQAEREMAAASAAEDGVAAWSQSAEFAAWGPPPSAGRPEPQHPQESPGEAEGQPADGAVALGRRKAELAAMLERIARARARLFRPDEMLRR